MKVKWTNVMQFARVYMQVAIICVDVFAIMKENIDVIVGLSGSDGLWSIKIVDVFKNPNHNMV